MPILATIIRTLPNINKNISRGLILITRKTNLCLYIFSNSLEGLITKCNYAIKIIEQLIMYSGLKDLKSYMEIFFWNFIMVTFETIVNSLSFFYWVFIERAMVSMAWAEPNPKSEELTLTFFKVLKHFLNIVDTN